MRVRVGPGPRGRAAPRSGRGRRRGAPAGRACSQEGRGRGVRNAMIWSQSGERHDIDERWSMFRRHNDGELAGMSPSIGKGQNSHPIRKGGRGGRMGEGWWRNGRPQQSCADAWLEGRQGAAQHARRHAEAGAGAGEDKKRGETISSQSNFPAPGELAVVVCPT